MSAQRWAAVGAVVAVVLLAVQTFLLAGIYDHVSGNYQARQCEGVWLSVNADC